MLSWSVVSSMFPFSAGARSAERDGRAVLSTAILLVVLITSLFTLVVWLAPARLWQMVLGSGFALGVHHSYSSLLVLYAATTGLYSLSVVLMSYEISRKIGNVSWLQLGFSGAIIAGIYLIHRNLSQVIVVQLVIMLALLVTVSIPFLRARGRKSALTDEIAYPQLRKLHRVSEPEVIAEFLRSEFYQPEFNPTANASKRLSPTRISTMPGKTRFGARFCSAGEDACGASCPSTRIGGKSSCKMTMCRGCACFHAITGGDWPIEVSISQI